MCVSPQAVSKWERGLSLPDIVFIDELALALGITIDELLTGRVEAVVA
jgi:transcriptional regulator with XRE-family HTH domain